MLLILQKALVKIMDKTTVQCACFSNSRKVWQPNPNTSPTLWWNGTSAASAVSSEELVAAGDLCKVKPKKPLWGYSDPCQWYCWHKSEPSRVGTTVRQDNPMLTFVLTLCHSVDATALAPPASADRHPCVGTREMGPALQAMPALLCPGSPPLCWLKPEAS